MKNAWMPGCLIFVFLLHCQLAAASDHHGQMEDHKILPPPKAIKAEGPVVAMDAEHARSYRTGELITAGAEPLRIAARSKLRAELSPRSVAEFDDAGAFRLLRGSAVIEQGEEVSARTPGARVEFVGKSVISYDHHEKSTSVFVLEGEARLVNPSQAGQTIKLSRFRGATMVVGEVLPKLVRQLDVGGVHAWLSGFSWPKGRRESLLKEMPGEKITASAPEPEHLKDAKIEDYFSSIETADELQQPDYYQRKFEDPDKSVADANSKTGVGSKALSPEEAALISLPKTQIDLGFDLGPEFLSSEQKSAEVAKIDRGGAAHRGPASVSKTAKPKAAKKAAARMAEQGDPDVNFVLERLRQVRSGNPVFSQAREAPRPSRAPSSVRETVVPDPVYDYSQNF